MIIPPSEKGWRKGQDTYLAKFLELYFLELPKSLKGIRIISPCLLSVYPDLVAKGSCPKRCLWWTLQGHNRCWTLEAIRWRSGAITVPNVHIACKSISRYWAWLFKTVFLNPSVGEDTWKKAKIFRNCAHSRLVKANASPMWLAERNIYDKV